MRATWSDGVRLPTRLARPEFSLAKVKKVKVWKWKTLSGLSKASNNPIRYWFILVLESCLENDIERSWVLRVLSIKLLWFSQNNKRDNSRANNIQKLATIKSVSLKGLYYVASCKFKR